MKHLTEMVRQHKAGKTNGIYAVCSAHPLVLEAAIRYASANQTPLLIEATSNQVDQFGGYTGMTPAGFRGFVCQLADSLNFPQDALILGGDHLGPNRWQNLPAAQAMANADDLIKMLRGGRIQKNFTLIAACPVRTIRFPVNRWHRGRTRRSFGESGGRNLP